jgi:exonuclease SbcC
MLTEYGSRRNVLLDTYRETLVAIARVEEAIATAEQELATLADAMNERSSLMEEQAILREQQRQAAAAARDLAMLGDDALGGEDLATELALKDEAIAKLGDLHTVEYELDHARAALSDLEHQLQRERQIDQQRASLEERLRASALAADQLPAVESRLAAHEQQLANEAYAHEDRVARDEAQAGLDRIQELGYSSAAHSALKQEHAQHQHWLEEHRALSQALETREFDQSARERTAELVARRSADLDVAQQELLRMSSELLRRRSVEADLIAAEKCLVGARARQRSAQEELGRVKQELASCAQVAELLEGYRAQHAALAEQRGIYEDLVQAFGKKGIQAMLIETAIPELEHESNAMLARMTDNQMHLSFETQRDSKKGDTIETLDIRIADGLGTRDYSMFSGGEAFRVNFAVRVALSKLLAHRADANLKTLVIDEGFGTQDSNGRDRIVEAINAVSPDFERILVITHIQELKDLFPAQIEVTKGPDGSAWRLV